MALREQYQRIIDRKRAEIEVLRSQLTAAEAYLSAMQDAMKLLPKETNGETFRGSVQLREGSKLAKVRDILKEKGKPMRIGDILPLIGERVSAETRVSLAGSLGNYARQGKIFQKSGPNEFTLLDYIASNESDDKEEAKMDDQEEPKGGDESGEYSQAAELSDDDIPF
jgi:hypothetical protein